jgi:sugar O-acyltransferase (sialic acid O-acetyltransferase NeuD family)
MVNGNMAPSHQTVTIIGAGGHASVVVSTLRGAGIEMLRVVDDDPGKHGQDVLGIPIEDTGILARADTTAIIAVGGNDTRRKLAARFEGVKWTTAVHPSAYVHPTAQLGPGTVVFAGSVIQPNAKIGAHAIINTGVTIDHDCVIGDFVHLAPGTHLAGEVQIGEGSFLGVGCSVIPSMRIGSWTTVGAGGVVIRDLPDRVTAVGVPARPTSGVKR